ncbi:MAG: TolC family outer membrane protein [Pseudomonadota bacterium]
MPLKRSRLFSARLLPVALALALSGFQSAQAEDLVELYNAARAYDATFLSIRAQAESAEYAAAQAKALRLPGVSATVTGSRTEAEAAQAMPPATSTERVGGNSVESRLNAKQSLFNAANSATIAQANKRVEEARIALAAAEQDLIVRVAQAYFDVLSAQDALNTARSNRTAITEQLASAKRNFEVGTATITDTREAQARFDLASAQEIVAENDLRTKRIALDQLVGRANVNPQPLAAPVALPPVVPADPQQWSQTAAAANPAIRRSMLELDVAKLETDKARAGHLPTVDLVASAGTDRSWGTIARAQGNWGTGKSATVGVQLNIPLFSGFSVQNRVKETLTLEEKARQDLEAARRDADQRTRTAYFGVQSGLAQVKALEAAEASSKLALEATQLGYKVGVRVNLDVLNAQNQLFQTQRDLARARYDVLVRQLQLRQVAGNLTPEDLGAVNQLLAKAP